jgi:hypothetical protein
VTSPTSSHNGTGPRYEPAVRRPGRSVTNALRSNGVRRENSQSGVRGQQDLPNGGHERGGQARHRTSPMRGGALECGRWSVRAAIAALAVLCGWTNARYLHPNPGVQGHRVAPGRFIASLGPIPFEVEVEVTVTAFGTDAR